MDEDKKKQISSLVKLMLKEGTSREAIKETMKEAGVSEDDSENFLREAGSVPVQEPLKKDELSEDTEEDDSSEKEQAYESIENLSASLLAEPVERPKPAEKHVSYNERSDDEDLTELTLMKQDIRKIKEILIELKPMISALSDLDKKILEENQKVLMRLKKE